MHAFCSEHQCIHTTCVCRGRRFRLVCPFCFCFVRCGATTGLSILFPVHDFLRHPSQILILAPRVSRCFFRCSCWAGFLHPLSHLKCLQLHNLLGTACCNMLCTLNHITGQHFAVFGSVSSFMHMLQAYVPSVKHPHAAAYVSIGLDIATLCQRMHLSKQLPHKGYCNHPSQLSHVHPAALAPNDEYVHLPPPSTSHLRPAS